MKVVSKKPRHCSVVTLWDIGLEFLWYFRQNKSFIALLDINKDLSSFNFECLKIREIAKDIILHFQWWRKPMFYDWLYYIWGMRLHYLNYLYLLWLGSINLLSADKTPFLLPPSFSFLPSKNWAEPFEFWLSIRKFLSEKLETDKHYNTRRLIRS